MIDAAAGLCLEVVSKPHLNTQSAKGLPASAGGQATALWSSSISVRGRLPLTLITYVRPCMLLFFVVSRLVLERDLKS